MAKQKNLLFIFTDEQAAKTMKSYGNHFIDTPNMDRLAAQSVLFERAYVTQPVCTPSRSTLLTGLWPHTNGCTENNVPLRPETPCFPELADFSDYRKAYFGKWHLGDEIFLQHGFDEWRSVDEGYYKHYSEGRDRSELSSYSKFLIGKGYKPNAVGSDGTARFSRGFASKVPEEYSKPMYLAGETETFFAENRGQPFMLFLNFFEPHMPYTSQRNSQYDPAEVPLPPTFREGHYNTDNRRLELFRRAYRETGFGGIDLKDEAGWRRIIANYFGLVSLVDAALGRILDALEQNGLAEDTIVVYTSDHGDMMGAHRLLAKCVMNEEAVRVPLLVQIPGVQPRRVADPVSQIDLVPTLLEAMERPVPSALQGGSMLPVIEGRETPAEDVFIEWNGLNNGFGDKLGGISMPESWTGVYEEEEILRVIGDPVRTVVTQDGYKYSHSTLGRHELFDLRKDPHELQNLACDPAYADRVGLLRERIAAWQRRTGDTAPRVQ